MFRDRQIRAVGSTPIASNLKPRSALSRLLVVSNRLPIAVYKEGRTWRSRRGSGGLVSALLPVLKDRGGIWIGWSGAAADDIDAGTEQALVARAGEDVGCEIRSVSLSREEVVGYYEGYSNGLLWPYFHGLTSKCSPQDHHLEVYRRVNQRFARAVVDVARPGDLIWVHDYQLMMVGHEIRALRPDLRVGFFLHIPFPEPDVMMGTPWASEIVDHLLAFDFLGFQTASDRRNFSRCVARLTAESQRREAGELTHRVWAETGQRGGSATSTNPSGMHAMRTCERLDVGGGAVLTANLPIGVDFERLARKAKSATVERELARHRREIGDRRCLLGVDRLDYTKGILARLRAFEGLLEGFPEYRKRVVLVQLVVPSREQVPAYAQLKRDIEAQVASLNERFGDADWTPVDHRYTSLSQAALVALYRAADVALVTSLNDGMNLVSKEFCAARVDGDGVLVLSEHAGAATQLLRGAVMTDPWSIADVTRAMRQALDMPPAQRKKRMKAMRAAVAADDVHAWAQDFLTLFQRAGRDVSRKAS